MLLKNWVGCSSRWARTGRVRPGVHAAAANRPRLQLARFPGMFAPNNSFKPKPLRSCSAPSGFSGGFGLIQALGAMGKIIVPAVWVIGVIAAVLSGLRPDPYLEHVRLIPPPHPYPMGTVLWIVLFMTVHAALLIAILRPASYSFSWGRALMALVVSLGFLALGIMGSMHAPPPWDAYLLWLLALVAATIILSLWSVMGAVRHRAGT